MTTLSEVCEECYSLWISFRLSIWHLLHGTMFLHIIFDNYGCVGGQVLGEHSGLFLVCSYISCHNSTSFVCGSFFCSYHISWHDSSSSLCGRHGYYMWRCFGYSVCETPSQPFGELASGGGSCSSQLLFWFGILSGSFMIPSQQKYVYDIIDHLTLSKRRLLTHLFNQMYKWTSWLTICWLTIFRWLCCSSAYSLVIAWGYYSVSCSPLLSDFICQLG